MNKEIKVLNYRELNIQGQLGRGAYGTVYLAHCDEPEVTNPVVVKVMHESLAIGDYAKKLFMKEAKLLSGLHHGNIVRMHGICENPLAIILEYMVFDFSPFNRNVKVNTLDKALSEIAQMSRTEEKQFDDLIPAIATDVTKGLSHLHQLDVAHRDLKPANILISNQHYCACALQDKKQMERIKAVRPVVCKLADFGESRSRLLQTSGWNNPNTKDTFRGTIPFMAPEILLPERTVRGKNLSLDDLKRIDIWALGMIFYCVINPGVSYPYEREAASDLPDMIMMVRGKRRPSANPKYHAEHASVWSCVKDAFESCTNHNASGRPKASDVLPILNPDPVPRRQGAPMRNEMSPRQRSAAKRHAGPAVQRFAQMPSGNPARIAADQWYAGTQGEQALKYVFDNFTNIADNEVKMSRKMDTQDVSLSLEHRGQHWQVTFPFNFPRSFASLTTGGRNHKMVGGDTAETAVSAIINYISSNQLQAQRRGNSARMATDQWYAGEQGEAALKYVFDKFARIADGEVKMSRMTDTQDVTLSFEHRGQQWQVAFPFNFPSSSARLTTFGDAYTGIGGETLEIAVRAIIDFMSCLSEPHADVRGNTSLQMPVHHQWYVGEEGEAALKYVFDELSNIADSEVKMNRKTDNQDLTLSFHQNGQDWQVKFPSTFPRTNPSLSSDGEIWAMIGGDTIRAAVNSIINHIRCNPTNAEVIQWYTGEDGEAALKYIFDELRNVADYGNVTMSRETDTQDVTLKFQRHGQDWKVKFPSNFPRSSASLSYNGEFYAMAGGNTVENVIREILNRIT